MTHRQNLRLAGLPAEPTTPDELWRAYKATDERLLRDQLIHYYMPLVRYVADRVSVGAPVHAEQADLVSAGMWGLFDAVRRFTPDQGVRFETYAVIHIRGAMIDELRRLRRWSPAGDASLEELLDSGAEEHDLPGAAAEDSGAAAEDRELLRLLAHAVHALPEREKTVVTLFFYEGLTRVEIADVLGLTAQAVDRLHAEALTRLRAALAAPGEDPFDAGGDLVRDMLHETEQALSRTVTRTDTDDALAALWRRIASDGQV
ncbi:sigma-70 family RNA polymerase sigma factor [Streptomyces sp. MNP-20]|uniref:sigma-70 family RNA polymerase sigma factor n=1 Tax=Streptomyces sp. MNP-20 TaxID=2721165 RepID=UPI0028159C80|nr:sigma-70 family RNA polymerase sigma factor [Streptomyces sp. MNP-20]